MIRKAKIMVLLGVLALCGAAWAVDDSGPIAHWKFDEGSGTTASDSAGDNDGTVYGATWTTGQVDGALSFDGVNDYVDVGDPGDGSLDFGTSDFTLSVWFKTSMLAPGFFVCKRAKGHYAGYDFYIQQEGRIFARIADGWLVPDARTTEGFNDGLWHHAAAVYDRDGVIRIYVDGVSKATSGSIKWIGNVNNSEPFTIGDRNDPGHHYYFDGIIDDVRIYNRALSAEEIRQLYLKTLAIGNIEQAIDEKEEMLEGIDWTLEKEVDAYDALEELLEGGDYGDLKKGDIVTAKQRIHSAIQHQEQSLDTLEKSIEKLEDVLSALGWEPEPNEPEPDPNLTAHWKFDEGSGTVAVDCIGDNDGTIYGAVWTTGQIDGALSFDGINDYVRVPDDESLDFGTGSFSISAWIRIEGSASPGYSVHTIVGKRKPTGNKNQFLFCVRDDSEALWFNTYDGSSSGVTGAAAISDGNWYHVAAVRDSNGIMELYVNGLLDNSTSLPVRDVDNDAFLGIGVHSTQGMNYFNGTIDDVRIYDKALSAEEVQQLYQDGL